MSPYDPGGRAGGIQQDQIEETSVPPAWYSTRIRNNNLRLQPKALDIAANTLCAARVHLQSQHFGIGTLEQMSGFTAGGRTGIENAAWLISLVAVQ